MNIQHAVFNHVQLEKRLMVHGLHMVTVSKVNVLVQEAGLLHNHALQQVVLIQQQQLAAQIMSSQVAARLDVQLELKPMVRGQPTDPVSKVNVLDHAHGRPLKHA